MLIVAPKGSINLVTLLSILLFSSKQRNVIGNVAALEYNKIFFVIKNKIENF